MLITDYLPKGFSCAGCGLAAWKTVCEECKENLRWNSELLSSPVCELEAIAPLLFSFSRAQALIRRFKEQGGVDLKKTLFRINEPLKFKLMETHFFAVVPIPQDQSRSFRRGHESALSIARFFSRELGIPLLRLLKLPRGQSKQITGLQKFEREWAINPFLYTSQDSPLVFMDLLEEKVNQRKEVRILLVDDLITSGSTLSKACSTLKETYPHFKIWGGGIGYRPGRQYQ
jgi:predicted amidophosphoribosyltransferase